MKFNNDVIFIRHAENIDDSTLPNDLLPLTKFGIRQAVFSSKTLENKFDIVICSTSKRAIMTAKIIAPNYKIIYDERLLECGWGNINHDGSETYEETKERIANVLNEYINEYGNQRILFVTHGFLIKLFQDVIEEVSEVSTRDNINNCDIIKYTNNSQKVIVKNKFV